jgi:serine/threonine protein kinase
MTIADDAPLLGRYKLVSLIGAGGMGQVYLARDMQLGRTVAVKILSTEIAQDPTRMRRFILEAKTASALNHPNIVTIYEVGETGETHCIVTEFIDGETLRQRIERASLKVNEAIEIILQMAAALSAAHEAGIVHRDIKPENVMVRRDGYVKVLDFGLAKLTEGSTPIPSLTSDASTFLQTEPGLVMGTVNYMSPEQARGTNVDARTDIWSTGCVLYEILTGQRPFAGATPSDVIASVLKSDPAPLAQYVRDVPADLERIILKALAKETDERYQTINEMALDLRRIKARLDIDGATGASDVGSLKTSTRTSSSTKGAQTNQNAVASELVTLLLPQTFSTAENSPQNTVSSVEYVVGEIKRHKRSAVLISLLIALVVATTIYALLRAKENSTGFFQEMKLTRLTTSGKVTDAAISPDGKYIAHAIEESGQQSLFLRQTATGNILQIVPPAEVQYRGITFSRDGNYVYYVTYERNSPVSVLQQVSVLGGEPRKLLEDIDTPVTFSPDGNHIAYVRNDVKRAESTLFIASADGSNERPLAIRKSPEYFKYVRSGPAWSPDGKSIATAVINVDENGAYEDITAVSAEDGKQTSLTNNKRWNRVGRVAWLENGRGFVMIGQEPTSTAAQIWYVAYPKSEVRRITNDLNNYTVVSLSADARSLIAVQSDLTANLWIAPRERAGEVKQITTGAGGRDGVDGMVWTPDGKIVFTSAASGNQDIWIMNADGSNQKQLTMDAHTDFNPTVTNDGRYVVFASNRTGNLNIWRMNMDGTGARRLTQGREETLPVCTPDNQWVVYYNGDKNSLWKVPLDGGSSPTPVTDKLSISPAISDDGALIACNYREAADAQPKVAVLRSSDGELVKAFDIPPTGIVRGSIRWTPDNRALAYVITRDGVSNIWTQPVDGATAKQLTDFKSDRIFAFAWSRDGRQLALSRGAMTSDVVLIKEF